MCSKAGRNAVPLSTDGSCAVLGVIEIVDINGVPGVRILSENREYGRTESDGRLLVPDLRSYDINHIAIDPSVFAASPDPR